MLFLNWKQLTAIRKELIMGADILINGIDIELAFGVCLEEGGLSVFEKPTSYKEVFFNEWPDSVGKDYDETAELIEDVQEFEVPFLIKGKSMTDYRKKKREFLAKICINSSIDFQVVEWGEAFKLRLKSFSSWEFINAELYDECSAKFTAKFETDPTSKPYEFKYLVDGLQRYIIINGNQRILVKTS